MSAMSKNANSTVEKRAARSKATCCEANAGSAAEIEQRSQASAETTKERRPGTGRAAMQDKSKDCCCNNG